MHRVCIRIFYNFSVVIRNYHEEQQLYTYSFYAVDFCDDISVEGQLAYFVS